MEAWHYICDSIELHTRKEGTVLCAYRNTQANHGTGMQDTMVMSEEQRKH